MGMRIVFVIDNYGDLNNGTTATARRYAEELQKRGHEVTILSVGAMNGGKTGVSKMKIPLFQPLIEKQGFYFARPNDEAYYRAFKDADIIHFFLPTWFCRRGEFIARQMKIPTVSAFHLQPENVSYSVGFGKSKRANDVIYRYFYNSFYNRFRYIHCPSNMIAEQLKEHGYDAEFRVISNGVNDFFRPVKTKRPGYLEGKIILLMVGRLSGEKRQDLLIEAVQYSKYRDQIQLVFAGQGPMEKKYRKMCKNLKNQPIFKFFSQHELLQMYNICDLYIHASDAEIEGISCLEAMACGAVPVISDSRLSATKSFALHPNCLFSAGNARSLAEKIDYWIEHPEERRRMSRIYAEKAESIRVSRCAAEMENLYREVIADFNRNGYKQPEKSWLRRLTHPDTAAVNAAYSVRTPLRQALFYVFTNLLALIIYFIDTMFFGLVIKGKDKLKKVRGGAVTVMNHIHPMDCTMVKLAVFPRPIYFTSLMNNLELPFVGWLIRFCGALPIPVNTGKLLNFYKQLKQGIQKGDLIHFYPEGMLIRNYEGLRDFHSGAFYTAVHSDCPVIPMVLVSIHPRGIWRIAGGKRRMQLSIGEPQYPNKELSPRESAIELKTRTWKIMNEMMNEPVEAEKLSLSLAVRIACILYLATQLVRFVGIRL